MGRGEGQGTDDEIQSRARQLLSVAEAAIRRQDLHGAADATEAALRLCGQTDYPLGEAQCHRLLGELALGSEDLNKAERHLARALALFASLGVRAGVAWCLLSLAQVDGARGRARQTKEGAQFALRVFEELRDPVGQVHCHLELARALRELGQATAACLRKCHDEVQAARQLLGERPKRRTYRRSGLPRAQWKRHHQVLLGRCFLELGRSAYWEDDFEGARLHLAEALTLFSQADDRLDQAKCHLELGRVAMYQEPAAAKQHLRVALGVFELEGALLDQANCLTELGTLAAMRGPAREAESPIRRAMHLYEQGGFPSGRARCLAELGRLAFDSCHYDQAQEYLEEAARLFVDLDDRRAAGHCLQHLGQVAAARHNPEAAWQHWEAALEQYVAVDEHMGSSQCRLHMARLLMDHDAGPLLVDQDVDPLGEARRVLDEASAGFRAEVGLLEQANYLQTSGALARMEGDAGRARQELETARELYANAGDPGGGANCTVLLGRLAAKHGHHDVAERLFDEALEAFQAIGDPYRTGAAALLSGIARLKEGKRDGAVERILEAVRETESLRGAQGSRSESLWWLGELRHVYSIALEVVCEVGDAAAGLAVVEAARAELVAGLLRAGEPRDADPEIAQLLETVRTLQAELDSLAAGGTPPPPRPTVGVEAMRAINDGRRGRLHSSLREAIGALEDRVDEFVHSYVPKPLLPEQALGLVPEGTWLLAYHIDEKRQLTRVWADPEGEMGVDRRVIPDGRVRRLLGSLPGLDPGQSLQLEIIGRPISDAFWADTLKDLARLLLPAEVQWGLGSHRFSDPARLLIVPTGSFWAVPWAALPIGGRPLCEYATVSLAPSLRSLPCALGDGEGGLVALIDSDLGLPFEGEREFFGRLYESAEFCDRPQDLHAVLRRLNDNSSREIGTAYVTCHGDRSPGLAHRLTLTSSATVLSAGQLLGLRVPPHFHMGACTSGHVAGGREPIGLATVALARGARYVTAAVWPIFPAGAVRFAHLYHQRLRDGIAPPEALRRTQYQLVSDTPDIALCDWAPFVVIGRP